MLVGDFFLTELVVRERTGRVVQLGDAEFDYWVGLQFFGARTGLTLMDGGWISPAKVKLLHETVVATCDTQDGLKDGIVSHPAACLGVMTLKRLRCSDGEDTGDSCLSDAQISAVETLRTPFVFPFALANGITSYPEYNYGGEDQAGGMVDSFRLHCRRGSIYDYR